MKYALAALACVATLGLSHTASAAVTTYSDLSSFEAAVPGSQTNTFADMGEDVPAAPSYTQGAVTFSSADLIFYDDAYGTPYISDNNYDGLGGTFTVSTSGDALGIDLGSYYGAATYSYVVNGAAGSISLPNGEGSDSLAATAFLGFTASSPVTVTFSLPEFQEVDAPVFYTGVPAVSAAPEPSNWLLMLAGIGGIGLAFRQVKRTDRLPLKDVFAG